MSTSSAPRVAIYGTGRAAAALARTLAPLTGSALVIAGRRQKNAQRVAQEVGAVAHDNAASLVSALDGASRALLFLAVSDDAIADVARHFAPWVNGQGHIAVVHLSGSQGLVPLDVLDDQTARGFFHPLAALDPAAPIAAGTVIGVGGDRATLTDALGQLATDAKLTPWRIRPGDAVQYHLAATLVANLPVALFAHAERLLRDIGIPESDARRGLSTLMRSMVDNLTVHEPDVALTGAVARGDAHTVAQHLNILAPTGEDGVYRALSRALARLARLDDDKRAALFDVLDDDTK